jgi:hypothetical protein
MVRRMRRRDLVRSAARPPPACLHARADLGRHEDRAHAPSTRPIDCAANRRRGRNIGHQIDSGSVEQAELTLAPANTERSTTELPSRLGSDCGAAIAPPRQGCATWMRVSVASMIHLEGKNSPPADLQHAVSLHVVSAKPPIRRDCDRLTDTVRWLGAGPQ